MGDLARRLRKLDWLAMQEDDGLVREAAAELERLETEVTRLREALNSDSANRYWEGRWRDEKAENERLRKLI